MRGGPVGTGSVLGDFRLEERLATSGGVATYSATQLSLGRRVALRLPDPDAEADDDALERFRAAARAQAALRHPGIVEILAAGESEHGPWAATAPVPARTLAALLEAGPLDAERALTLVEQVARALDVAHAAGLAHGRLRAATVLIGDRDQPLLTDLTADDDGDAIVADRRAFAALVSDVLRSPVADAPLASAQEVVRAAGGPPRRRPPRRYAAAAGAAALVAITAAMLAPGGGERDAALAAPAPPVARGAAAFGSALTAGAATAASCDGSAPDVSRPVCTVLQTRLPGRLVAAPADGAVRRWAVRGARGELALVIVRQDAAGARLVARSQAQVLADPAPRAFPTDLPVRRGDLIGVELAPGAAVGMRPARGRAGTHHWLGTLRTTDRRRRPVAGDAQLPRELLVRAEVVAGARRRAPRRLDGPAAAAAAAGRIARRLAVPARDREVQLVRVQEDVAVDLLAGGRRVTRIGFPGGDAAGVPESFRVTQLGTAVLVSWRNPDGRGIFHEYRLTAGRLRFAY